MRRTINFFLGGGFQITIFWQGGSVLYVFFWFAGWKQGTVEAILIQMWRIKKKSKNMRRVIILCPLRPPLQPSIFDLFREICWIKIPLEKFNCFKANVVVSTFWVPLCQKGDSDVQGGNHSTVRGGPIFVEMPPKLTGLPPKNPKKEVMFNHVGPTR